MQKLETLGKAMFAMIARHSEQPNLPPLRDDRALQVIVSAFLKHGRECPHCHELLFIHIDLEPGTYACPACERRVRVYGNRMQWDVAALAESWVE